MSRPAATCIVYVCVWVFNLEREILSPLCQLMLLWNYFVHVLKYSSTHFAPGGLAGELSDALSALSLYFPLSFPHTHTYAKHFSVMWLAECKISSLQLEGNRFDKIPSSPRGAFKAQSGMVKARYGTSGLTAIPTDSVSAWPHGAYLESTQWPYRGPLVTALWPLTEHWQGLFSLCFSSINWHCIVVKLTEIQVPRLGWFIHVRPG